jgi:hypothetical protein
VIDCLYENEKIKCVAERWKMLDYDEIGYSEIEDCIIDAREGNLSSYWQGYAEREFDALRDANGKFPERARRLYKEYKRILKNVPQAESDEEKALP